VNKVETQGRIARNLAVLRYQVENLNANGQNISAYCETAICDALNAVTGHGWTNANAAAYNFPAIDLVASDGNRGVQATLHTTKTKLDKTIRTLKGALFATPSRLDDLREIEVVGLTCVNNTVVTSWQNVAGPKHSVKIRGIALGRLLRLQNLDGSQLSALDDALQGLTMTTPFHLSPDEAEAATIIAYLDRPAIRDARHLEGSWQHMQDAMRSIRRLLTQGANDLGQQVTRPHQTFQPGLARLLKEIYTETEAISALLRSELRVTGSLTSSEAILIDGHRLRIQEKVTELARRTRNAPPTW
jgi:post-segregation antitoxin (ccd killing protein)